MKNKKIIKNKDITKKIKKKQKKIEQKKIEKKLPFHHDSQKQKYPRKINF